MNTRIGAAREVEPKPGPRHLAGGEIAKGEIPNKIQTGLDRIETPKTVGK